VTADTLTVDVTVVDNALRFGYEVDGQRQAIRVGYPFDLGDLPAQTVRSIALGVAVYLGQLCLAPRIRLSFSVTDAMVTAVRPLAGMLYDVRRWKDELPITDPPIFAYDQGIDDQPATAPMRTDGALLLWSGGKDSTLSAVLLGKNGYDVRALHVPANAGVEKQEDEAVGNLAIHLGLAPVRLDYEHREFLSFSTRYASRQGWNRYPACNVVPFGRDLLLALLAIPVARHLGLGFISMGHDNECRNSYFEYGGRSIPRNDVESTRGALALEAYAARFALPGVRLLPPVAGLPELRILHEMLTAYPELMERAAFCFWGGNCGRCAKCLRYYLAQRTYGIEVLRFQVNPLAVGACPELDELFRPDAVGVLFQRQVLYCLGRLVERGDVRADETRMAEFQELLYPAVRPHLDAWEHDLLCVGSDPQLPSGFRYSLRPVPGLNCR
jgi:7-cyano-7-deazaguanine synthase in queuosine biosynthesis